MPAFHVVRRSRGGSVLLTLTLALGVSSALIAAPAAAQQTEAPGKPTIASLTGGDGHVTVSFEVPTPGTDPITGYRVRARNLADWNEIVTSAESPASPISVTGLTNGAAYTFWVTALSANGSTESDESDALNVGVPPSFPSHPAYLPPATVGQPYEYTVDAVGAPIPTVVWVPSTSPVPPGLTYDFVTRTISGTPTTAGTIEVLFAAHNALGFAELDTTLEISEQVGDPAPEPGPPAVPADPPAVAPTAPTAPTVTARATSTTAAKARTLPSTGIEPVVPFLVGTIVLALGAALLVARAGARRRRATNGDDPATH